MLSFLSKDSTYLKDGTSFYGYISEADMEFSQFMLMHMIVMAHLAGGLMIIIGMVIRSTILIQVPVLLGVLFFVGKYAGVKDKLIPELGTFLLSIYVLVIG